MRQLSIQPFTPALFLDTPEAVAAFLEDARSSGDESVVRQAILIARQAEARNIGEMDINNKVNF